MARSLTVWGSCIVLALLGVTGAHGHRTVTHPDSPLPEAHDGHSSIPDSKPLLFTVDSGGHEHGHAEHGHVDVNPPVKVLSKPPTAVSADLVFLLWAGIIVSILRLASSWVPLSRIDRPPKKRWHPFQLPPAQAPPHTA